MADQPRSEPGDHASEPVSVVNVLNSLPGALGQMIDLP